ETKAFKLGLQPVTLLLAELGNPQHAFRSVHVAGTNGKGSTCAMIESGLRAAGLRTGLYTSPHLVNPTERIQIDGVPITAEAFAAAFETVHLAAAKLMSRGDLEAHPSYFETVTAMAFVVFRDCAVQTAVVEVGLGGRLDATNVISPALTVITPIDYDHEAWLGSSLEQIAAEKAGILKPGVPAVLARQRPEVQHVLDEHIARLRVPAAAEFTQMEDLQLTAQGCSFRLGELALICPLRGEHQAQNALTAVNALLALDIPPDAMQRGILAVRWPGRLELVSKNPELILDGAHNPAGALALADYIRRFYADRPVWLIYGAMRDKAVEEITELLFPLAAHVILTAPAMPRAVQPRTLLAMGDAARMETAPDIAAALTAARKAPPQAAIFVTGSLYLVGEARALLVQ
ncbi:MAG: folylpolyglutamate synthase/dihydrofolate synthase family protein, partial [Bryobacteraceae bacterium]